MEIDWIYIYMYLKDQRWKTRLIMPVIDQNYNTKEEKTQAEVKDGQIWHTYTLQKYKRGK